MFLLTDLESCGLCSNSNSVFASSSSVVRLQVAQSNIFLKGRRKKNNMQQLRGDELMLETHACSFWPWLMTRMDVPGFHVETSELHKRVSVKYDIWHAANQHLSQIVKNRLVSLHSYAAGVMNMFETNSRFRSQGNVLVVFFLEKLRPSR